MSNATGCRKGALRAMRRWCRIHRIVRPDFVSPLADGRGIVAEVERGVTTTNNHDLNDIWKVHIAQDAQHLFLVVPAANWNGAGLARERPFARVSNRLAAFFGGPRREVDVLSCLLAMAATLPCSSTEAREDCCSTGPSRLVPTARSVTRPAALRICRCCCMADRVMDTSRAMSVTEQGCRTSRSTIVRRVGSANASR